MGVTGLMLTAHGTDQEVVMEMEEAEVEEEVLGEEVEVAEEEETGRVGELEE